MALDSKLIPAFMTWTQRSQQRMLPPTLEMHSLEILQASLRGPEIELSIHFNTLQMKGNIK